MLIINYTYIYIYIRQCSFQFHVGWHGPLFEGKLLFGTSSVCVIDKQIHLGLNPLFCWILVHGNNLWINERSIASADIRGLIATLRWNLELQNGSSLAIEKSVQRRLTLTEVTVKVAKIKVSRKSYSKLKAALKVEGVTRSGRVLTKHSLASFVVSGNQSSSQWDPKNCRSQSPSNFGPGWIFFMTTWKILVHIQPTWDFTLGVLVTSHFYICQRYMSNVPKYIHLYPHSNMLMVASVTSQKYCQSRYSQLLSANLT